MVSTQHDCSRSHDLETPLEDLIIAQTLIPLCSWVLDRIRRINAIDLGGFRNDIGINFDRAQAGGRIGSKTGIAGARREHDPPPFFPVAYRPAPYVIFTSLVD